MSGTPPVKDSEAGLRVLIFAPTGSDGQVTSKFLTEAGHAVLGCRKMSDICREAAVDCGVILLAEETLSRESVGALAAMLGDQPPWSDIPVTVVTSGGESSP